MHCLSLGPKELQHVCYGDDSYKMFEVNMFMRQMVAKNLESQIIVIKSPRNLYACLNSEYQWLLYNLSPNTCNVDIVCDRFEGGDCGRGDYVLQIFSIQHWNLAYKVYHNDKKGNENERDQTR